jgi:hypothetical protein
MAASTRRAGPKDGNSKGKRSKGKRSKGGSSSSAFTASGSNLQLSEMHSKVHANASANVLTLSRSGVSRRERVPVSRNSGQVSEYALGSIGVSMMKSAHRFVMPIVVLCIAHVVSRRALAEEVDSHRSVRHSGDRPPGVKAFSATALARNRVFVNSPTRCAKSRQRRLQYAHNRLTTSQAPEGSFRSFATASGQQQDLRSGRPKSIDPLGDFSRSRGPATSGTQPVSTNGLRNDHPIRAKYRCAERIKLLEHAGANCSTLQAAQRAVRHAGCRMAGPSNAPGLILSSENATAPRVAMAVWTATT